MAKSNVAKFMILKIELRDIEPMIWRRLVLKSRSSLSVLHRAIQASMGWSESHLHQFEKNGLYYGPDYAWDPDFGPPLLSQNKQLQTLFDRPGEWLRYEYDFGDGWTHLIEFEYWSDTEKLDKHPLCVDGARACPPEDCGGPPGYHHLLEVINNPNDDEYASLLEWTGGGFDPEQFDVSVANQRLAERFQ